MKELKIAIRLAILHCKGKYNLKDVKGMAKSKIKLKGTKE